MHRGCMTTLATGSNGAGSAVCAVAPRPEASERTTMNGATLLIACSSRRAELALERQLAYPLARRREDRVRQCWCRNRGAWLAYPARCLRVPHQMHFDRRRSEEHTSELQSRSDLVCRLLLEKKKNPLISVAPLPLLTFPLPFPRLSFSLSVSRSVPAPRSCSLRGYTVACACLHSVYLQTAVL